MQLIPNQWVQVGQPYWYFPVQTSLPQLLATQPLETWHSHSTSNYLCLLPKVKLFNCEVKGTMHKWAHAQHNDVMSGLATTTLLFSSRFWGLLCTLWPYRFLLGSITKWLIKTRDGQGRSTNSMTPRVKCIDPSSPESGAHMVRRNPFLPISQAVNWFNLYLKSKTLLNLNSFVCSFTLSYEGFVSGLQVRNGSCLA